MRVEPHQGRFARRIGLTQGKLSTLEMGTREPKAEDLAAAAIAGIDVQYVLIGKRSVGDPIEPAAARLMKDYFSLPNYLKEVAQKMMAMLANDVSRIPAGSNTVHDSRTGFNAAGADI